MELSLPYFDIEQEASISLLPQQMNGDILLKLKLNLKEKVEKRCNNNGYIDKVYKIKKYEDGLMLSENLSGSAVYKVLYECRIYIPVENNNIVCEVLLITPELIIANHENIQVFIPRTKVNGGVFDVSKDLLHMKRKEELSVGDKIIVRILNKRINNGEKYIRSMGYLEELASEEDIKEYYPSDEKIESNFII